jgi:tetratricopeptide (TPR) repeat protein
MVNAGFMTRIASAEPAAPSHELQQLWEHGERKRAIATALEHWEQLVSEGRELHWLGRALRSVGLPAEACAVQLEMTRRQDTDARVWEPLIRSLLQSGDPWWARTLLEEAPRGSRSLDALRIEAELALESCGVSANPSPFIDAWLQAYRDDNARASAVEWWLRAGRVDDAERLLQEADGMPLWHARLALWRKQPHRAKAILEQAPPSAEARCLQAVAELQEGHLEHAEPILRGLLDSEVQGEAWGWLATVLRKQRRYAEAVQAADKANAASSSFNLALRLERELATDLEACQAGATAMRTIAGLRHPWAVYPLGLRPEDSVGALEALLERIAGNHTPHLTTIEDGRLVSHRLPPDPGQVGVMVQRVLWTRGPDAVRALYRDLAPCLDDHPHLRIFQGEFELWMGAYAEAEGIFRQTLEREPNTKWAWIGLGAALMFQGNWDEAQRTWEKGESLTGPGPTLHVYRGECFRRQAERAHALRDLEEAVRQKAHRLSARINLALLQGDREGLQRAEHDCAAVAPLLMEELTGTAEDKLEKVLEAMRGNRSSSMVSYHLWGRLWRTVSGDSRDGSAG